MGRTQLIAEVREIQAITMLPKCMLRQEPAWKKPVIIASLVIAVVVMGFSLSLMGLAPMLCGFLFILAFGWTGFVWFANREVKKR